MPAVPRVAAAPPGDRHRHHAGGQGPGRLGRQRPRRQGQDRAVHEGEQVQLHRPDGQRRRGDEEVLRDRHPHDPHHRP